MKKFVGSNRMNWVSELFKPIKFWKMTSFKFFLWLFSEYTLKHIFFSIWIDLWNTYVSWFCSVLKNVLSLNIGGCLIWVRQNDPIETDMSETEAPPLVLIWLRHLNHSLQRYDWDAKLSVDTNITETPRPDLAPIWLRQPISDEYIHDCDAFYLWHTYDWDIPTRSCTHMTETPKIFFMIYNLTKIWLRRSKTLRENL